MIIPTAYVLAFVSFAIAAKHPPSTLSSVSHLATDLVGATATFQFPPADATLASPGNDANFPVASEVGFPGPTPTGDEAISIETAPAIALHESFDPIIRPNTFNGKSNSKFDVVRNWGNLSPWFSLPADTWGLPNASPIVPTGCDIQQVHILHRHGARYPTSSSGPATFATKLHNITVNGTGFSASGPAKFLNTWEYRLGAEILTPLGRQQLYELGVSARVRYGALLKEFTDLPVWRTTSEERMVDSALQFAAGFFGVQEYATSYHQLIQIEQDGFNTTLSPNKQCPNSNIGNVGQIGNAKAAEWAAVYTPSIIERLSKFLDGVNLTSSDIVAMQDMCAYESVALGFSSFCDLFTESEWEAYEYHTDLIFWYSNGPGGTSVAAQGIGYVQELIARLTQTPLISFDTTTNATLDASNVTFPLDQPIFVDASHDTFISAIAVALNLTALARGGPLPTDRIAKDRRWIVSHISPFSTNLVAQVLSCPANGTATHIRWIFNDAVVPLTGVRGCAEDKNGLCELNAYIEGTKARIAEVDFAFDCFANYTVPDPDLILDGRFPQSLKNLTA
ncbi:phosphoglycerate mutase-like protein [Peniophora sp. CONT]|nr:phosphoglycerate mutase-like protein [Peniophora sp. CONT]